MMVTDAFVFVHQPKTGGHFVREALIEAVEHESHDILRQVATRFGLASTRFATELEPYHGTCHDIPSEHRKKPVLSVVRNPFDYYVSLYHYGWWITHAQDDYSDMAAVRDRFPHFPDLTFDEFLILTNGFSVEFERLNRGRPARHTNVGLCSARFISFYFKQPQEAYASLDLNGSPEEWLRDMYDVRFLKTHTLSEDLYDFLFTLGYRGRNIAFVKNKAPVIPLDTRSTPRPSRDYMSYYSRPARELVLAKDLLLFKMFPEFVGDQK